MEDIKRRRQKMGEELPLARSESGNRPARQRGRPSVLLVGGRPRLPTYSPNNRNKRKETVRVNKEAEDRAFEDSPPACSIGAEDKAPYGDTAIRPKRGRYRKHDKGRKSDNGAKGADSVRRRSAEDMGVVWIGDYCPDNQPHHLVSIHNLDGGSIFKCKHCYQHIWLPSEIKDASRLESLIGYLGAQAGYCKFLNSHRPAKIVVAKLQDLWRAKQMSPNNGEFLLLVLDIMKEDNYDARRV